MAIEVVCANTDCIFNKHRVGYVDNICTAYRVRIIGPNNECDTAMDAESAEALADHILNPHKSKDPSIYPCPCGTQRCMGSCGTYEAHMKWLEQQR